MPYSLKYLETCEGRVPVDNYSSQGLHVTAAECGGRISFKELRANNDMWLPFLSFDKQQTSAIASSLAFTYLT
jgi:hypothetical protein